MTVPGHASEGPKRLVGDRIEWDASVGAAFMSVSNETPAGWGMKSMLGEVGAVSSLGSPPAGSSRTSSQRDPQASLGEATSKAARLGLLIWPKQVSWLLLVSSFALVTPSYGSGTTSAPSQVTAVQLVAMRDAARAYEHGEGIPKDPARAVELYCEAARLGDPEAQYSLGWMYANGRGVVRDDGLAALFFELAARQGDEHARTMLRFVGDPAIETPECMRAKLAADADVEPEDDFVALTPSQKKAVELVKSLAPHYGVSPRLALAVIRAESNFDPMARSEKNAQGLMQLIAETAARFSVKKPFDPAENVRGGLAYLRWLLAYFQGNVALVAAAYNAGEGAVNRYRGVPPYGETRGYVKRILRLFGKTEHPFDSSVTEPSPELQRMRLEKAL